MLVAISIFLIFVLAITNVTVNVEKQAKNSANRERAVSLANEAIEVSRNIRDNSFANLVDGTYGLSTSSNQWIYSGLSDTSGIFTRQLTISTLNANQKQLNVTVSWPDQISNTNSVTLSSILSNWQAITPTAGITVLKTVINHGGTKVASDFAPFKVGTTTVTLGVATNFIPGEYTISETTNPNYIQTFSGGCTTGGLIELETNDAQTCTITNEEKPSNLTVTKTVINHGLTKVASDFTLFVDSTPVTSGNTNTFNSGSHTVSETADSNYNLTFSGDCNSGGVVALAPGITKACTLTNEEKLSYITVNKTVVNNGGTKVASDFAPFKVGSTIVSLGVPTVINSGTYTVSEATDLNYLQSFTGDCDLSGVVTINSGNNKVCTITNTELLSPSGMLVYGNGGTSSDAISYKIFNSSNGTWTTASSTADIDGATTNKALRAVRVYSSPTRNEKIVISKHYNGTAQSIYAQVFNGTTWGNVQLLSSWNATTFLDVQNFDGTYLANGTFMVVFSDNTIIPKMRTWNGSSWSGQTSLTTLATAEIPAFIVTKTRPGTNEVMMASFSQNARTSTEYYNGSIWSSVTSHAASASVTTKRLVDFDWSPNNSLVGGLIYSNSSNDRALHIKIWTANGSGSGAWSSVANTANQGSASTRLGAVKIVGRPGANEFDACADFTVPSIICFKSDFTPTWTNPTNPTLGATTDAGIQRTFDIGFEQTAGTPAIGVYTDTTIIPKLKKYTAGTATWDVSATSLSSIVGTLKSVRVIPKPLSNDIMVLMGDSNLDVYSIVWDGTNNVMYSTPVGKALTTHGTNGSATAEYWYDFTWN